jgi:hypothetical protein
VSSELQPQHRSRLAAPANVSHTHQDSRKKLTTSQTSSRIVIGCLYLLNLSECPFPSFAPFYSPIGHP